MPTTPWASLPAHVRAAVTAHTGPVAAAHDVLDGYNCQAATILDTPAGPVFVKAAGTAAAEAALAPLVAGAGVGPRLRFHTMVDGWHITGHDALPDARHADLSPVSADLLLTAGLLARAATIPAPRDLPTWADQWTTVATPDELGLLVGGALVHGDVNQHNLLVSGSRAWLVDWVTAARGPAWADTAEAAIRAMEDGCTPAEAARFAAAVPAWQAAPPAAIRAWAAVRCRAWTATIGAHDARHSNQRHHALAEALITA